MRPFILVLATVAALGAAAGSASAGRSSVVPCSSGQIAKTTSYVFALTIGPVETMYTRAQMKAEHPKTGEVMLSGHMTGGMAGMTMSTKGMRHLEVHICNRAGAVVTNANPTIVVTDATSKSMPMTVPIVKMEGVTEGAADLHYGNNVTLAAGHRVTVTVTLKGQKAVFHTTVPHSSM